VTMDTKELVFLGEEGARAYCCGKCGRVYALDFKVLADGCCVPVACSDCGKPCNRPYHTVCAACSATRLTEKEHRRFESARKVSISEFFSERPGLTVCVGDDNFYDEDGLSELADENEGLLPEYFWGTTRTEMNKVDAEDVVDLFCADLWEEATEAISPLHIQELQKFLETWREKVGLWGWEEDLSVAVVPTEKERQEYLKDWKNRKKEES